MPRAVHRTGKNPVKKNSRFIKVLIAVGVVAASGGASLGITSLVSANTSSAPDVVAVADASSLAESPLAEASSASDVISAAADDSPSTDDDATSESTETKVMRGGKGGAHSAAMAELFGMTQDELHEALHSGKSLAAIAEEKNIALSKVTDLLIAEFSAHLDKHVADGDLTREEADAKLAEFTANVDQKVTMTPPARGEGQRGGKGHGPKIGAGSAAMAELLGMTQDELREALHSGKSLAAIAEEKNVALSDVKNLLISEFSAHLDEEVASGEHTREEADAKLAKFTANVDQMMTMTPPVRGGGHRGDGHRGGRGHGGMGHRGHGEMNGPSESLGDSEGAGTTFSA